MKMPNFPVKRYPTSVLKSIKRFDGAHPPRGRAV